MATLMSLPSHHVFQGLEEVVRHMAILNRKMEAITSLRYDFGNVTHLWTRFHELVQQSTNQLQQQLHERPPMKDLSHH
jgi:hypothetical protein